MKLRTYGAMSLAMLTLLASGLKVGCQSESEVQEIVTEAEEPNKVPRKQVPEPYSIELDISEERLVQTIIDTINKSEIPEATTHFADIVAYIKGEEVSTTKLNDFSVPFQELMKFDHLYNDKLLLEAISESRTDTRMALNFDLLMLASYRLNEFNSMTLQEFVDWQVELEERLISQDVSKRETRMLLNTVFGIFDAQYYDSTSKVTINGETKSLDEHTRDLTFPNLKLFQDISDKFETLPANSPESEESIIIYANKMQIDWKTNTVTVKNKSKLRA